MSTIKIQLLGKFEILVNGKVALEKIYHTKKTRDFLAYLILRKDKAVPHSELFESLWIEDENANPENALRTLLYRFRNFLVESHVPELKESIITNRGTYQWNPDLDCEIDVFEFERLYKEAHSSELPNSERIKIYKQAMSLYSGDLLPVAAGESWVIPKSVYYHDLFLKNAFELIDLLKLDEMHQEIIQVCKTALDIDLFEDRLHMELIQALMQTGKNRAALTQYQATSDLYYKQLGIAPSENIRSLYKNIIRIGQDMEVDIQRIQQSIDEEDGSRGAFVCEYEIFKSIYHLQNRLLERTGGTFFIALLTINSTYNEVFEPLILDYIMNQLLVIAQKNLRRGDTIARYSSMQYIIMLPMVNYETGKMVIERVKKAFYKENVKSTIMLSYKLRPLGQMKNK